MAKETAKAAPTLCTEYGPNGWMDDLNGLKRSKTGLKMSNV